MRLFLASVSAGLAAYWLAIGAGIPAWGGMWPPGDAADIGVCASLAFFLIGGRK